MIASPPPVPFDSSSSSAWAGWLWGTRQGGEHDGDGAVPSMSSGGRATGLGLGLGSRPSRCHFLGQFDKHSQRVCNDVSVATTCGEFPS